jgi:formate dehydrogenase major subunit/formate dehydrogenase alpha subunit
MDEINKVTPSYAGLTYDRMDKDWGMSWPCPKDDHPGTPVLHQGKFAKGTGTFIPAEHIEPKETPDEEYDFILSTGRNYFQYHTGTMSRRTAILHREEPTGFVEINTDTAKRMGINQGDWVMVKTRRGEVKTKARLTKDIEPRVLFMTFHFNEAPANRLTINALDPVAKIPEYKCCAAKIEQC